MSKSLDGEAGQTNAAISALGKTGIYLWAFVAIGLMMVAWSLATPLGAAPDEPTHMVQAAAAVRGELAVQEGPGPYGPIASVLVPRWVANTAYLPNCFAFRASVPAGCSGPIGRSTAPTRATTQFSNYPPAYYLIVGLPTLLLTGESGAYAIRLTGVLVNAALLALGIFLLGRYHASRWLPLGVLVALSPMVLFVTAVAGDSGLETSAAFAAWCGGLCTLQGGNAARPLVGWTALAFAALILSRPVSPYIAAVILLVLAIYTGRTHTQEMLRGRHLRPLWIVILAASGVAAAFLLVAGKPSLLGTPTRPPLSMASSIRLVLRQTVARLRQCIGLFGWLDTPVPYVVTDIWVAAVASVSLLGMSLSVRIRRALPVLALAIVTMPVVFEAPRVNPIGLYWQGRYWLPLAVGVPLVATALAERRELGHTAKRRSPVGKVLLLLVAGVPLVGAEVGSLLQALRRYQVGLGARSGAPIRWSPPGGVMLCLGALLVGEVMLIALVGRLLLASGNRAGGLAVRHDPQMEG